MNKMVKQENEMTENEKAQVQQVIPLCESRAGAPVEKPKRGRRKRLQEEDGDSAIKITLSDEQSSIVRRALSQLRERGAAVRAEEILGEMLRMITPERLDAVILELTPDEYYLQEARKIPDLKAMFVRYAKKAVLGGGLRSSQGSGQGNEMKPKVAGKAKKEQCSKPSAVPTTEGLVLAGAMA